MSEAEASPGNAEPEPLAQSAEAKAPWWHMSAASGTGLFLFAVGAASMPLKGLHRHYTLWGLPLNLLEFSMLFVGALLMLSADPKAPWGPQRSASWWSWLRYAALIGFYALMIFLLWRLPPLPSI